MQIFMIFKQATIESHLVTDFDINDCLLVDKPSKISTFDIIRNLKKYFSNKIKIGHGGTLDPFATGLVIILFGKSTKIQQFIQHSRKIYSGKVLLGIKTDTLDMTGKIIKKEQAPKPSQKDIANIRKGILSINHQIPPKYSAVKKNGIPLYKYARKGVDVSVQPREIKIYDFEITDYRYPYIAFKTEVSGGTYIRSLAESIGNILKTYATLEELRRLMIDNISVDNAVPLSSINSFEDINVNLLSSSDFLIMPEIIINKSMQKDIINGKSIAIETTNSNNQIFKLIFQKKLVAIGKLTNDNRIHPVKVLV